MKYVVQYLSRKGVVENKKFEASSAAAVRDRIRKTGAKKIIVFPEGQGYICPCCNELVEGYNPGEPCRNCKY